MTAPETSLFATLLAQLGEDPTRGGLRETPARAAKAWAEWTSGYGVDPATILKTFDDGAENYDGIVFQGGISLHSHCEHHMAPIFGVAHVGYIPGSRVVGLSKLARVVDVFAKRLQVQERMTTQIAQALQDNLAPRAVGVVLQCRHFCIESRGVARVGSVTTTSSLHGAFRDEPEARAEFMAMVRSAQQVSVL
jgi:GTP cyclohydrolase I